MSAAPRDGASIGARIAFAAASLTAGVLLVSMGVQRPGWIIVSLIWGAAALAATRPFDGLLVLAGLGPLITALSLVLGSNTYGVHFPEALTLAFLAGASARRAMPGPRLAAPRSVAWPAIILLATVLASAGINAAVLHVEQPDLSSGSGWPLWLVRDYLALQNPVTIAVQFGEGLLLLLLAADLSARHGARRERVLVLLVAGAAGAATLNVFRLVSAAMQREDPWTALAAYLTQVRVNVQFGDWNAAGSYFAMTLIVACAFLARRRFAYSAPAILLAIAIWITGSRTALAAVFLTAAGAGLVAMRRNDPRRNALVALALVIVIGGAVAGWMLYPAPRNDPAAFSIRTRMELWRAGVSMMATSPVFGVGIGGFYTLSHQYAPVMLESIGRPHENAHNYFIQVLAELGIPGLLLFLTVVGSALFEAWRAAARGAWTAWTAGIVAFLLTCLAGHPLVVPDASYPFWIALGVAAAAGVHPDARVRFGPYARWTALAAVIVLLATIPSRARDAVRHANMESVTAGLSVWQRDDAGVRFRWSRRQSAFYVPSAARAVRIPLRPGPDAPPALTVRVLFNGREAERVVLHKGDDWRTLRIVRMQLGTDADFSRIDLQINAADGGPPASEARLLMVGQPNVVWRD